jgi:hypothetical protein
VTETSDERDEAIEGEEPDPQARAMAADIAANADEIRAEADRAVAAGGFDSGRVLELLAEYWARMPEQERRQHRPLHEVTATRSPDGIENPYYEVLLQVPTREHVWLTSYCMPVVFGAKPALSMRLMAAGLNFDTPRRYFTWSAPTPTDLALITEHAAAGIVEIGAGGGYWARMLTQYGLEVAAYDIQPGRSETFTGPAWYDVKQAGPEAAAAHPDRALMLCWPMKDHPMAAEALAAYEGDTLIFAGVSAHCGDAQFWKAVERDWTQTVFSPEHYPIWGFHDQLAILRRAK